MMFFVQSGHKPNCLSSRPATPSSSDTDLERHMMARVGVDYSAHKIIDYDYSGD